LTTTAIPPLVTVVVPTLNEERYIERCLASIQAQTYPAARVEVIVVDGGSRDRTRSVVTGMAASDPRITLLDNPHRIQAAGFNLAIERSAGDIISLASAHSVLHPSFLDECVLELARSGADNVGGQMLATGEGAVEEAIAAAMRSPAGVGGAKYHYTQAACDVPSVWPGCFRREVFERVGRFRADLAVHEDFELNHRIRGAGGRVRFSPRIIATYHVRTSLSRLARQYFRYGRAKAGVAREVPGVIRPYHLGPPALVAALGASLAAAGVARPARYSLVAVAGVYGTALLVGAAAAGRGHPIRVRLALPGVLATMHLCWGAGMWAGLIGGPPRGPRDPQQQTTPASPSEPSAASPSSPGST
jgi:succinoglycan biosynthesis protein ExoA